MLVGIPLDKQKTIKPPAKNADEMASHLVRVAEGRCQIAFSHLFNYFAPRLRSYGIKQIGNEALAMELVQDTLSNVWQKAHLFNAEKGSASTWIFTIARNIRYDMLRKQQNRKEDITSEDLWPILCEITPDKNLKPLDDQLSITQLRSMFSKLPDKQKIILEAIYFEGKSQQEVAESFSLPLGTVKSRTRLALQKLKGLLNDHD